MLAWESDKTGWLAANSGLTWIPGLAIGTAIVSMDILKEVLEDLLIARLLAFAEGPVHGLYR